MADNDVVQRFQQLFEQKKYKEAAELAVETVEITLMQLEELQIERDTAVEQKEITFKKLEELYKGKEEGSSSDAVNFTEFSYSDLKKATNNFNRSLKIGEGTFGSVYKGSFQHTPVAIKFLNREGSQSDKEFSHEVETLRKARHPNLVSLIGVSTSPEARALIYEFIPSSLQTYLTGEKSSRQTLSWQNRIRIASEICSALLFLHSMKPRGIAHGRLNPQNVLLDSNLISKLTDFGLSREMDQTSDNKTGIHETLIPKGNLPYVDPAYVAYHELTLKSDVFSFGIILMQLVTGKGPRGLRGFVEKAMINKRLDKELDGSAGKWPINEAIMLASLGLECSHPMREHRPDLAVKVWPTIDNIKTATGLQ